MKKITLKVKDIYCEWCEHLLRRDLDKINLKKVVINRKMQMIYLAYNRKVDIEKVHKILRSRGIPILKERII